MNDELIDYIFEYCGAVSNLVIRKITKTDPKGNAQSVSYRLTEIMHDGSGTYIDDYVSEQSALRLFTWFNQMIRNA